MDLNKPFLFIICLLYCVCGSQGGVRPELETEEISQPDVFAETETDGLKEIQEIDPCSSLGCPADQDHAPDPRQWGPYPVGVKTIIFEYEPDGTASKRTLKTEIWYPTEDQYQNNPRYAYDLKSEAPKSLQEKFSKVLVDAIQVNAIRDAPVRKKSGRFPLVAFSHGAYGIRFQSVFFTIQLASHGYVVFAPDHQGNVLWDMLEKGYDPTTLAESAVFRPKDIAYIIKEMEKKTKDPNDDFYDVIDVDNIGMSGHSFGGYVCFAVAVLDLRVKAIVPMAPAANLIVFAGVQDPEQWHIPTMMMGGEMDKTLDFKVQMKDPWDILGGQKWFLALKKGGHYTFTDICKLDLKGLAEQLGYVDAKDALEDGCGKDNIEPEKAHEIINLYAIGVFNVVLRKSKLSDKYLTPEAGAEYKDQITFWMNP